MHRLLQIVCLAFSCAFAPSAALAVDCSQGYVQGPGGYYRSDDRSGPYFIGPTCIATPMSGAVTSGGSSPVDTVVQGTAVYRGGTITAGGASQQLLAANAARRGYTFQNQGSSNCFLKIGGAAATLDRLSRRVAPGEEYASSAQHVSSGVVNVTCVDTGAPFYATEF